ncbi:MAG: tetratricopeptide repeat protein, partial [Acidobacteria bacterium]|nr:tetratricopeptide repeat protein [Acidobacteriota bacterium]
MCIRDRTLSYQLVKKGEMLESDGKRFKAYISYKKAIKIFPENTIAYLNIIRLHLKENNIEKARATFEKVIEKYPQKFHYFVDLIKELYSQSYQEKLKEIALVRRYKRALFIYLEEVEKKGTMEEIKTALETLVKYYPRSRTLQKKIFKLISEEKIDKDFVMKISSALSASKETLDPFVCINCGYKTQDILLRCPNCKEWNSFADTEN